MMFCLFFDLLRRQQAHARKDSSGNIGQSYASSNHNNSNTHNSSDGSKKEEFRKYLEKTGVLETLTKVLVGLYEEPEKPTDAIAYIKKYIGAPENVDVEGLKKENEALRRQLAALGGGDHLTLETNHNETRVPYHKTY
jgi:hypothetical protein